MSDERGAVLIIVAISSVLLIGMAALVVDVSAMYEERRELQNGADAAALAVAEDCARGLDCAYGTASSTATNYADANAADGVADASVDTADFDPNGRVTVHTSTKRAGGETALSFLFAPVLGHSGATIHAASTVIWGAPRSLQTLPITISFCEWKAATNEGTNYATAPYSGPDTQLTFHDGNGANDCAAVAGQDTDGDGKLPAGFGWLKNEDGACRAITSTVDGDSWVVKDPGTNTECAPEDIPVGQIVYLPVFGDYCRDHSAGCPDFEKGDKYKVDRYAAFYIDGYDLGNSQYEKADGVYRTTPPTCATGTTGNNGNGNGKGVTAASAGRVVIAAAGGNGGGKPTTTTTAAPTTTTTTATTTTTTQSNPAPQDARCISGFFVKDVYDGSGDIGGPDGGVELIRILH